MADSHDLADEVARLQKEVVETRKQRMAAQKVIVTKPVLEVALERASRNRSSGATDATDASRDEINSLRADVMAWIYDIDKMRRHFATADAAYPGLPARARVIQELNDETRWRDRLIEDERLREVRLNIPQTPEVQ